MKKEGPTDFNGRFHPQSLLIYSNYNTLAETVRNIFKNEVNINSWTFEKNYIFEHVDLFRSAFCQPFSPMVALPIKRVKDTAKSPPVQSKTKTCN